VICRYYVGGKYKESYDDFKKALALNPENTDVYDKLVQFEMESGGAGGDPGKRRISYSYTA